PGALERPGAGGVGREVVRGQQMAVGVENIHNATEWTGRPGFDGKEHKESSVSVFFNLPRAGMARRLHRYIRIGERTEKMEGAVEHINLVIAAIGCVQDNLTPAVLINMQAAVHRPRKWRGR